jgi:hypothetical protein
MDPSTLNWIAAALLAAAVLITVFLWRTYPKKAGDWAGGKDRAVTCDICFGSMDGRIAACACGKTFHDSCALPTGSCPYCGAEYGSFAISEETRVRCLNCGRPVTGSTCRCGAIFPDDGRFVCGKCGETVDGGVVCGKCGTAYVLRTKDNR